MMHGRVVRRAGVRVLCALAIYGGLETSHAAAQEVTVAPLGGTVRWLDKVSGEVRDIDLAPGVAAQVGRLAVVLDECRFPVDDPASNAFAHLQIRDDGVGGEEVFSGWMIADSPALSALDHWRYDLWLLRCITASGEGTAP